MDRTPQGGPSPHGHQGGDPALRRADTAPPYLGTSPGNEIPLPSSPSVSCTFILKHTLASATAPTEKGEIASENFITLNVAIAQMPGPREGGSITPGPNSGAENRWPVWGPHRDIFHPMAQESRVGTGVATSYYSLLWDFHRNGGKFDPLVSVSPERIKCERSACSEAPDRPGYNRPCEGSDFTHKSKV